MRSAGSIRNWLAQIRLILGMIKFQHTLFALPFALTSLLAASGGLPGARVTVLVAAACIAARSMAMAFNRLVDRRYDAANPRTADRALPRGLVTPRFTGIFTVVCAIGFVVSAGMLNWLCLVLSPVAIAILLGYSYCKRFTEVSHLVLGVALGIAPIGAWMAATGSPAFEPLLLAAGVVFWVAGFDILYACQDVDFDRLEGLHSLPARLGIAKALLLARWLHGAASAFWFGFLLWMGAGTAAWIGWGMVIGCMVFEHRHIARKGPSAVAPAFFTANAAASLFFLLGYAFDLFL